MAALVLKNISKSYSPKASGDEDFVLRDFSLEIAESEFLVIVGPSGCGKSTLIRSIAGLETIDSGEIEFRGKRIDVLAPKDRELSMVFQNYALYPHKTVYENIAFPLRLKPNQSGLLQDFKTTNKAIDAQVKQIASSLGLDDLLKRKPKELSGGQRQRVALARALVKNPQIFLLDEPLSNLDAKLRSQMRSEIHRLHKESGKIFIYVTHDQIEALSLGDRIAVLDKGRIMQIASPEEIYLKPANTFVASFIGSPPMNLIPLNDETLKSFDASFKPKFPNSILGLRPENISVQTNNLSVSETNLGSEYRHQIKVKLENIEYLGYETIVYTHLASAAKIKLVVKVKQKTENGQFLPENVDNLMFFNLFDLCYFDTISGTRLAI